MEIIALLEIDRNEEIVNKDEVEYDLKNLSLAKLSQVEKDNIAGQWLVVDEIVEIDNEYLISFHDQKNQNTVIKLPAEYVAENYLVDYTTDDKCPVGIDALIKENGYSIGVVSGCKSIKQAKVQNNLDGYSYEGQLGFKLNDDYFLYYDKKDGFFDISETITDWDRGKRTI